MKPQSFLLLAVVAFHPGILFSQTTWTGATSGNYGTAGNWSPATVPGSSTNVIFGDISTANTTIDLGANRTVASARFTADADAYTFNNFRLALNAGGALSLDYGLLATQTFNSDLAVFDSAGWIRNNSLSASNLVITGNLTNADNNVRLMNLGGLGGGSLSGDIVNGPLANFGLIRVAGGGTWTFTGTNSSTGGSNTASTRLYLANGATFVADATSNNGAKLHSGQQIQFSGGNFELRGNTAANTTATAGGVDLTADNTAGSNYGFGSTINTVKSGSFSTTFNMGSLTRNTTNLGSYLRILGDGTVTTTTPVVSGILSGVFVGNDYAAKGAGDSIVAYTSYTALPTSSGGSGSTVYSVAGSHTTDIGANTVFSALGMKIDTTAAGQSLSFTGSSTQGILATSNATMLFIGAHDYSINATTIGRADTGSGRTQTLLNTGTGVLTLNAALNTIAGNTQVIQFGGPGTTVLTQAAASSAGTVRVAEGVLRVTDGNALGATTPSVGVQSGGTLALANNITLSASNVLSLHGLGNGGNGALRSISGANTVAGNIVLGITSRIQADTGASLTLNGTLSGVAGETPTLLFSGGGTTTVSGQVQASINGGMDKIGAGVVNLSHGAGNLYAGSTRVSAGTLLLNNSSGSATGSGNIFVASGATLGGNGLASGSVTVAGSIAAGNSIGTLSTGDLSITSTGSISSELGRSGLTPVADRVNVTGFVSLASGSNLQLTLGSGLGSAAVGDLFFLLSNDSTDAISGVFTRLNGFATTLNQDSTFAWNSQTWQISYTADFGASTFTGGNDIALLVIPEPSSVALLVGGVSLIGFLRWRRRING